MPQNTYNTGKWSIAYINLSVHSQAITSDLWIRICTNLSIAPTCKSVSTFKASSSWVCACQRDNRAVRTHQSVISVKWLFISQNVVEWIRQLENCITTQDIACKTLNQWKQVVIPSVSLSFHLLLLLLLLFSIVSSSGQLCNLKKYLIDLLKYNI